MKRILLEYINIISYTIMGIIFGTSFFLLLINFYHYRDINKVYNKQESDYKLNDELKSKLNSIDENIKLVQLNPTDYNYMNISNIQSRLTVCVEKINTPKLNNMLSKSNISISDIYEMQQFYKIDIANECLVKELYGLTATDDMQLNSIPSYTTVIPFIEDNIDELRTSTDYVEKVLKNNSSYSFVSDSTKNDVFDQLKDSYYEIVNDYINAVDFIYDISVWYKGIV